MYNKLTSIMINHFKKNISLLIDLIFPKLCLACEDALPLQNHIYCGGCIFKIGSYSYDPKTPSSLDKIFFARVSINRSFACTKYVKEGAVANMVHRFKYKQDQQLAFNLGKHYGAILKETGFFDKVDYLVPIPMTRKKMKKRGFNQASVFSYGIAKSCGIPVEEKIILKIKDSISQTKKTRTERVESLNASFKKTKRLSIEGKHLLLIDDVLTTGATFEACASKLLENMDVTVSVLCFAKGEMND